MCTKKSSVVASITLVTFSDDVFQPLYIRQDMSTLSEGDTDNTCWQAQPWQATFIREVTEAEAVG